MKIISIRKYLFLGLFLISGAVFSQDLGSETVIVVKPYTPSVNDASKIKEVPEISDSVSLLKEPVQYRVISVPVASTFTPAKGRATNIEREDRVDIYDNYATLGFGNYTSVLAEFYSNLEINRSDNFGIFLTHNSSQGGIEGVPVEDKYYNTDLNLNYSSRQRNSSWNTQFGVQHQLINWYGIEEPDIPSVSGTFVPQQNYYSVYAGGELKLDESFFDNAKLDYRYFGDAYSSMEHHLNFNPSLEVPIAGELFNTEIVVDYLNGSFERGYFSETPVNYSFLNLGLSSGILVLRNNLSLNLGAAVFYSRDLEDQDGGVYIYPEVKASYRLAGEYFVAYAGLEGALEQNTYHGFVAENPFVSPTLMIKPTDRKYEAFIGAKGKFSNSVGYNIKGSYTAEEGKPLFVTQFAGVTSNTEEYTYGNSFGVLYDAVKTVSAFGELSFDVNRNFLLRINAEFFTYDPTNEAYAWNLPNYKASLLADYQIGDNWFAGANFFLVGERRDREKPFDIETVQDTELSSSESVILDSYFDLNANFGYRFNEQLSLFAKGSNLLGKNYEKWQGFPVLGLQVMAGVTYKFDY